MFLKLNHQQLDIYAASRKFVLECYRFSKTLPQDEKFGMATQIRRAALSVHLNIAEGCSRKSEAERKRYFEVSRGSLIEVDAAIDIANDLKYMEDGSFQSLEDSMITCFKILSGLIEPKIHH